MAHCKAPMRAIFILVFTAVQANALAPRGLATPPDITQSVRRVVRQLGRKMGMSIKSRRAREGDKSEKKGEVMFNDLGHSKTMDAQCCVEKTTINTYQVVLLNDELTCQTDKMVPLPAGMTCTNPSSVFHLIIPKSIQDLVRPEAVMKLYFEAAGHTNRTIDDVAQLEMALKDAIHSAAKTKREGLNTDINSADGRIKFATARKAEAETTIKEQTELIKALEDALAGAMPAIEEIGKKGGEHKGKHDRA